ncbi:DUF1648 domain-containing protein [Aeromicrobium phragmitis]|uniref:DUF1648 domain-containing protein n=1 Tax=Aeromicrobium phragmitis TaxID=2478914 RepID=A0A3L8PNL4_9ACTN|nr:DUF1648 domain-containing protein [Aeromicrobium phragmitis]RLV56108.1 DUF1648 domain-containing protein [Aeromicrobium phragmitis]
MTRHRWAVPIVLGLPLVIAAIGVAVVLAWMPELPAQVATHWGSGDEADGFTSRGALPWMFGALSALIPLFCSGLFLALGLPSRSTAAFGAGLAAFLVAILLSTVAPQRGLEDAADATIEGWWIAASIVIALLVALVTAALTPRDRFEGSTPAEPVPASAGPTTWTGAIRSDVMLGITGIVAVIGLAVLITPLHILGYVLVPTALVLAVTAWWKVTVDERGVVVRSAFGWPSIRVRPEQFTGAEVEHVSALGEFGGWGVRMSPRGTGIVLSTGEAVVVHRRGARPLIVVIDDADGAAAAINSRVRAS